MKTEINEKSMRRATGKRYAELLCDFMFKRIFGSEANKDVLIGFLNMVLEDTEIVEVEFIPTEHQGFTEDDRKVVFDIACKCKDSSSFIIEMQKGYQKYFRERALYYTTYPINEQGRRAHDKFIKQKTEGETDSKFNWDYNLKPVTVVSILNFKFNHCEEWPKEHYRSSYRLHEDTYKEIMTDAIRFVFLELGRFNKYIWELETTFDKWMYLLKHMHEMVEIPKEFEDSRFKRLFLLAEIDNFTDEERKQYEESLKNMGDYNNIINTATEEAEKRGLARGREEGKIETIKALIATGVSMESLASALNLSEKEIKSLVSQ